MASYLFEGVSIGGIDFPAIQRVIATPTYVIASENATAVFSVAGAVVENPGDLKYQWQYSSTGKTWSDTTLTGNKTATLSIKASAGRDGYQYRCIISRGIEEVVSNPCKLKVMKEDSAAELPADPVALSLDDEEQ